MSGNSATFQEYRVSHRALLNENLTALLEELRASGAVVPNVKYDGVQDLEKSISKAEELRLADTFLEQFGWNIEAFQEDARRLVYRVCVGYFGITAPLPLKLRSMVLEDTAASFRLWPQSALSEQSSGKQHGTVGDGLFGFEILYYLLKPGSEVSNMIPAGSQEIAANPDLQAQLMMVNRALAFILGGCEFVSQVSKTWDSENIERTKQYHEANIIVAKELGETNVSYHLSFIDNENLLTNDPRLFNYTDVNVSGSNRQGLTGAAQEAVAQKAFNDHVTQIEFFGEMKIKHKLENMTAVLHFGIVGKEMSDAEFNRATLQLTELLVHARKHGTTIAVENQGMSFEQYKRLMELFPEDEYPELGFCFDIAHAQIEFSKNGVDGIRKLWELIGHRVVHVHISQTVKKFDPETGEFMAYLDLHPRLRCHSQGISMRTFRWVIEQAQQNGRTVTFTVEAQPNAIDILALQGIKTKRNLMSAGPDDLPLQPIDVFSPLLKTEISFDENQTTYNAMKLFYSQVHRGEDLDKVAWEETMQLTNWRKTDVHSEKIEAHILSGRLGTLLQRIELLITDTESKFALSRHTALLVLLFSKLESIQKALVEKPNDKELGAEYDAFEQIAKELMGKVNDFDLVVVGETNKPEAIHQALLEQGLEPRNDKDRRTGRARNAVFRPGGLTEYFGQPHPAFESTTGSGLYYFKEDDVQQVLDDNPALGETDACKVEVMEGFGIAIPGFPFPVPLSAFAKELKIPETIEVTWANKQYRILHPTLILLSYYSEQKVYEKGPAIFDGDYVKWAEKLLKAITRAKLTFVGN